MKIYFDEKEAARYGLKKAIILSAIRLLIIESGANGGEFATYRDCKMLHEKLPFLSEQTINRHVENLLMSGVLYLTESRFLAIRNEFSDDAFESEAVRFLLKRANQ